MFLFFSLTGCKSQDRVEWAQNFMELNYLELRGFGVLWKDDCGLTVEASVDSLSIRVRAPGTEVPIELVNYKASANRVKLYRPWPGNEALYVAVGKVLIVTTHLQLWSCCGFGHMPLPKPINAGGGATVFLRDGLFAIGSLVEKPWSDSLRFSADSASEALAEHLSEAMRNYPKDSVILLSGGVDSAAMAACAPWYNCVTWTSELATLNPPLNSDVLAAECLAKTLSLSHETFVLDLDQLVRDLPGAVMLSETRRGTLVEDAVVYVQLARRLAERGVSHVFIGESADDGFGCLNHYLRYYQGNELQAILRKSLAVDAPNDHASISRIFGFFGLTLVDPFLSLHIAELGYSLPLNYRLDKKRIMKPLLRKAFEKFLPMETIHRPKVVSRDSSGVRKVMVENFGSDRNRFLRVFRDIFRNNDAHLYQQNVLQTLNLSYDPTMGIGTGVCDER